MVRAALAALACVLSACAFPGILLPAGDLLRDIHVRGPASAPLVALTFDDGPNGKCTEAVLDALAEVGAPATFFVLGRNIDHGGNDEVLARMVREGHVLGLHGYGHEGPLLTSEAHLTRALDAARAALDRALARAGIADPPSIRFFRPPFGFLTEATARAAASRHLEIVEWTISVGDWRSGKTAEVIAGDVLARARPGDVIVLHDGLRTHQRSHERCTDRAVVADAVRLIVPQLRARGLRPAPLAEVLGLPRPL